MNNKKSKNPYPPFRTDRTLALFLFGIVVFNPPILSLFGIIDLLFGWPVLYFYIFIVWLFVIVLMALYCEYPPQKP